MLTGSIDPFTNFLWLSGTANKNAVEISLHFGEAYEMGNPYYGIPFHYQTWQFFLFDRQKLQTWQLEAIYRIVTSEGQTKKFPSKTLWSFGKTQ